MKKFLNLKILPLLMLAGGAAGILLRWGVQSLAVDAWGLPAVNHPLRWGLWLVTLGIPALAVFGVSRVNKAGDYGSSFPASVTGAAGHFILAACIVLTLLIQPPELEGSMGNAWWWLGIGAAAGLTWAGICRLGEKPPCFIAHLAVCLFLAVQILSHYPAWCGMPEVTEYLYALLGAMALLFYGYYRTACDVGLLKKRKLLTLGLLAAFLCTVALWDSRFRLLYGGGICWVLADLNAFWEAV